MRTSALAMVLAAGCGHVSTPQDEPPPDDMPDAPPAVVERDITVMIDGIDADFVAVQSGDEAFAPTIGQQGRYTAKITSDRYGVAIGCKRGPASTVRIVHRTATDGLEVRGTCGEAPAQTVDLFVNMTNTGLFAHLQGGGAARVTEGDRQLVLPVRRGFVELVGTSTDFTGRVVQMARLAPIDVQASQLVVLDLFGSGAALQDHPLTVQPPPPAGTARVVSRVATPLGTFFVTGHQPLGTTYQGLSPALRRPGDFTEVTLVIDEAAGPLRHHREVTLTAAQPGPLSFAPLATIVPATPVLVATPTPHPRFTLPTEAGGTHVLRAAQSGRDWTVELSASYAAGVTTYELPELSTVQDAASYTFAPGNLGWSIARVESTSETPADGRIQRTSRVESVIGCGDAIVQPGEACDTAGDSPTCDADCTPVVCGDGRVNPTVEQCDDADDPEGICLPNCTLAF